jgi:hypothetical protein
MYSTAAVNAQKSLPNVEKEKPASSNHWTSFVSGPRKSSLAGSDKLQKSLNSVDNTKHGMRSISSIEHPMRQQPDSKPLVDDGKYSRNKSVSKDEKALPVTVALSKAKSLSVEELRKMLKQNFVPSQPQTTAFESSMLAKIAGRADQKPKLDGGEQSRNSVNQANRTLPAAGTTTAATMPMNAAFDRNSRIGLSKSPASTALSQKVVPTMALPLRGGIPIKAGEPIPNPASMMGATLSTRSNPVKNPMYGGQQPSAPKLPINANIKVQDLNAAEKAKSTFGIRKEVNKPDMRFQAAAGDANTNMRGSFAGNRPQ